MRPYSMPILLKDLIEHYKSLMLSSTPPAIIAQSAMEERARRHSTWYRAALRAGDQAPDIRLPISGQFGLRSIPISHLLREGPALLKFIRGRWCPFCTLELKAYEKLMPRLRESGVRLIVISGESGDEATPASLADPPGLTVVRDASLEIARAFGLTYSPGPAEAELCRRLGYTTPAGLPGEPRALALPALYLIGTDRTVLHANVPSDPSVRDEPTRVLQLIQESCGLV